MGLGSPDFGPTYADNVLMAGVSNVFLGTSTEYYTATGVFRHLTAHHVDKLASDLSGNPGPGVLALTNCVLANATNLVFTNLNFACVSTGDDSSFTNVGAGFRYLAAGSTNRSSGTTNIPASLRADFARMTTFPPVTYEDVTLSNDLILVPQVARDPAGLDRGYHYPALDFDFGGVTMNANVRVLPGTVVAWHRTSSGWYHAGHGIHLADQKTASFEGTADAPCWWIRRNLVQEGEPNTYTYGPGGITGWAADLTSAPVIQARFTRFSMLAYDGGCAFRDDNGFLIARVQDSEFWTAPVGGYWRASYYTNCLFDRGQVHLITGATNVELVMRNCTMHGGWLSIARQQDVGLGYVGVHDCIFDGTLISPSSDAYSYDPTWTLYTNNAYTDTNYVLLPTSLGDIATDLVWQTGPLGRFYLPSNSVLVDASSNSAASLGLSQFTTQTNQTKEGNTPLDRGYHYVAMDASTGAPLAMDSDGDGVPDYLEDANGNGVQDIGETDWRRPDSPYLADTEPLGPSSRRTGMVISEIMYSPPAGQNQFVEIYNAHYITQDLQGMLVTTTTTTNTLTGSLAPGSFTAVDIPGNALGTNDTVRLLNKWGAVLLEVSYLNQAPWPAAAQGTGCSLVLARPSYGENNPKAWAASQLVRGSKGTNETTLVDPLRPVLINEWLANGADFIELYNHSRYAVDISGCVLRVASSSTTFVIPNPTTIPSGGFISFTHGSATNQFGFDIAGNGDAIFLLNPPGTRVLDAVRFGAQEPNVSTGRFPNGANAFYALSSPTIGSSNTNLLMRPVVINEIMYNPISGDNDDQYVELHNRSATNIDVGGWVLDMAPSAPFTIPQGRTIVPGGYLVIVRYAAHMLYKYNLYLSTANCAGDFSGKLSHNGQRIALLKDGVLMDEVTYGDGGQWGQWADGGGSSLELRDPHSDRRLPSNWADSDDTTKAPWVTVQATGKLAYGDDISTPDTLEAFLLGPGECLVGDVLVNTEDDSAGSSRIANGDFANGAQGWTMQGTHDLSGWEPDTANGGLGGYGTNFHSLHLRATDAGDYLANRIYTSISPAISADYTGNVAISAKVRWLRGQPEIVFRLRGNYFEATGITNLVPPGTPGTPGTSNSVLASGGNAGPAIFDVQHRPVLPAAYQPVVVSARVYDPDGLTNLVLRYRIEPASASVLTNMVDDGTFGDAVAGDGVFSASIPGQSAGTIIAFQILANDGLGATNRFPSPKVLYPGDQEQCECLVRFGESKPGGSYATYHIWMTQATVADWTARPLYHNGGLDATLVYGESRVVYGARPRYAGSPNSVSGYANSPLTSGRWDSGFAFEIPSDDPLAGATSILLPHPARAGWDAPMQKEPAIARLGDQMGIPMNHRRFVHLFVNGAEKGRLKIYEEALRPSKDFVKCWFPGDDGGDLFKLEVWWKDTEVPLPNLDLFHSTMERFATVSNAFLLPRYRWTWQKETGGRSQNDYSSLFTLVELLYSRGEDTYGDEVAAVIDVEEWMRVFALERIVDNTDSYGMVNGSGHNMYAYKPSAGKWQLLPYDFELAFWHDPIPGLLFPVNDTVLPRLLKHPCFERGLWRTVLEETQGDLLTSRLWAFFDANYAVLQTNLQPANVNVPSPEEYYATSLAANLESITGFLQTLPTGFSVTSLAGNTASDPVLISGIAPVTVATIAVNSADYPIHWTSVSNWSISIPLMAAGYVPLTFTAKDRFGSQVGSAQVLSVTNISNYLPGAQPVLNEVMAVNNNMLANTANGQSSDWVELYNPSNAAVNISGYRLRKNADNDLYFPSAPPTIISPGGFLLVWCDNSSDPIKGNGPDGDLHAPFKIGPGDRLRLYTGGPGSTRIDDYTLPTSILANTSFGRFPDGAGGTNNALTNAMTLPTPRHANRTNDGAISLWINEWMPAWTNEDFTVVEAGWLELANSSELAIDVTGFTLTDDTNNWNKWTFPPGVRVPAGGFCVLVTDGNSVAYASSASAEPHTSFVLCADPGQLSLYAPAGQDTSGSLLDSVAWTNSIPPGQSMGRCGSDIITFTNVTRGTTNSCP